MRGCECQMVDFLFVFGGGDQKSKKGGTSNYKLEVLM